MLYLAILWLDPSEPADRQSPAAVLLDRALGRIGVQLVSLGILAELVTAYNIRAEDTYSVAERIPSRESQAPPEPARTRPPSDTVADDPASPTKRACPTPESTRIDA